MPLDDQASVSEILDRVFGELFGLPCWNVRQGWGSFITFEFGNPSLRIEKVIPKKPDVPDSRAHRTVYVRGEWHLWIYCCGWKMSQDGKELCIWESSKDEIRDGCQILHGQALSDVKFRPELGRSRFSFDLGGQLMTGPYNEEMKEQWMLYCPDGNVLTYRSDGAFSYGSGSGVEEEKFRQLEEE